MNLVIQSGRLTKDAELSYIASTQTPKLAFTLAVERNYQKDKNNKKVDFINYEMLGKGAESLATYLTKGKKILINGEMNIDQYQKNGENKSFTKVKVDRIEFIDGNKQENNNSYSKEQEFQPVEDDDIPF